MNKLIFSESFWKKILIGFISLSLAVIVFFITASIIQREYREHVLAQSLDEFFLKHKMYKNYVENLKVSDEKTYDDGGMGEALNEKQYTIELDAKKGFSKLNKTEKYIYLSNTLEYIKLQNDGTNFKNAKGIFVITKAVIKQGNKTYAMIDHDDSTIANKMTINGKNGFAPESEKKRASKELDEILNDDSSVDTSSDDNTDLLTEDDKMLAYTYAQGYVKDQLKSPSSARFPTFDDSFVAMTGDTVEVSAYVDADNSFGANIRNNFTVNMDQDNNLKDVSIDDNN